MCQCGLSNQNARSCRSDMCDCRAMRMPIILSTRLWALSTRAIRFGMCLCNFRLAEKQVIDVSTNRQCKGANTAAHCCSYTRGCPNIEWLFRYNPRHLQGLKSLTTLTAPVTPLQATQVSGFTCICKRTKSLIEYTNVYAWNRHQ